MKEPTLRLAVMATAIVVASSNTFSQVPAQPGPTGPTFDVVSIRPAPDGPLPNNRSERPTPN